MDPQPRPARSGPTPFSSYRSQLTLAPITFGIFFAGLVTAIVAGAWAGAALVAVFVAGWIARVLMIFRINRLGGYTADPRPDVRAQYRPVLRTQLVGWILVSIYFVITGFWWGLLTSVTLGLFSLLLPASDPETLIASDFSGPTARARGLAPATPTSGCTS